MKTRTAVAIAIVTALWLTLAYRTGATGAILMEVDWRSGALPAAISANNYTVVGALEGGGGFYWVLRAGGIFNGGVSSNAVSGDGRTIVGSALDHAGVKQAAIWLQRTDWQLLGSFSPTAVPCDNILSAAYGVSRDGQIIVGNAWDGCKVAHGFSWNPKNGMVDLGSSVQGQASLASGVSGDGHVVVGYQTTAEGFQQGARWADGQQQLITGPQGVVGSAKAANVDGSIVVGRVCHPGSDLPQDAWMWTVQGGTTCLPAPKARPSPGPKIIVEATATSDDGRVIGGAQNVGGSPDSNAVLWIGGRPAYLKDFLQVNGVPDAFATWVNTGSITGMTPDGRVLVGWGAAALGFRGYLVVLPSNPIMP